MRHVFTCLTSGRQRVLSSMAESVFLADPDCPTLVDGKQAKQQKFCPNEPGGRARLFFFFSFIYLFISFISFILLIQFNFVTYVPSRRPHTTTARVHCRVKSGPVSRSNRAPQCAIVRTIPTRTNSHDLYGRSKKPKHARAKSAKRSKKINKSRKPKEKPCGPWPSLPSAVLQKCPYPSAGSGRRPQIRHWAD